MQTRRLKPEKSRRGVSAPPCRTRGGSTGGFRPIPISMPPLSSRSSTLTRLVPGLGGKAGFGRRAPELGLSPFFSFFFLLGGETPSSPGAANLGSAGGNSPGNEGMCRGLWGEDNRGSEDGWALWRGKKPFHQRDDFPHPPPGSPLPKGFLLPLFLLSFSDHPPPPPPPQASSPL